MVLFGVLEIGGLQTFQDEVMYYAQGDGTPKFNPFFIPKIIADIAPAHISMRNGYMGPNYTTVSACASSANALIDAYNYIRLGMCDVIVSGGSEAAVLLPEWAVLTRCTLYQLETKSRNCFKTL